MTVLPRPAAVVKMPMAELETPLAVGLKPIAVL